MDKPISATTILPPEDEIPRRVPFISLWRGARNISAGIFYLWLTLTIFDTFYDVWVLGGLGWLIVSIIFTAATILLFPLVLWIFWGIWGQALAMYIILPILLSIKTAIEFQMTKRGIRS